MFRFSSYFSWRFCWKSTGTDDTGVHPERFPPPCARQIKKGGHPLHLGVHAKADRTFAGMLSTKLRTPACPARVSPVPEEDEDEEMEEMLQEGPAGKEWGGPTRGGVLGEPTRFGDWERKGRCSDF